MNQFWVKQFEEPSLLFKRDLGIEVRTEEKSHYSYRFKLYKSGICQQEKEKQKENIVFFTLTSYGDYKIVVDIFDKEIKIASVTSPEIDFLEDLIGINEIAFTQTDKGMSVYVDSKFKLAKEYYAYYLEKDDEVIQKVSYTKQNPFVFQKGDKGVYKVRVYIRLIKNNGKQQQVIAYSNTIVVT